MRILRPLAFIILIILLLLFSISLHFPISKQKLLLYLVNISSNSSSIILHIQLLNNGDKLLVLETNRTYILPNSPCSSVYPFSVFLYYNNTKLDIYDTSNPLFCFSVPNVYYLLPHSSNLTIYDYNFGIENLTTTVVISSYYHNGTILPLPKGDYVVSVLVYNHTFNYTISL
jgi:hypothetical protein